MMKSAQYEGGSTLKRAAPVPAARIVVIEDNSSDVFLLERALKQQDLRFELIHLPTGDAALAYRPQAGRLRGRADSKPDSGGLEPVQVHRPGNRPRDSKRGTPLRRSGVRVELVAVAQG